ncbi:MAG: phage tail assembly protein T [Rhodoferax sp.]
MSSDEFTEWLAYYQLEPFGEQVADLRHGTACALLANVNRIYEQRPEPYRARDFIDWGERPQVAPVEPIELDDPIAQSNLLRATLFGLPPKP